MRLQSVMPYRHISESEKDAILADYYAGMKFRDIANRHNKVSEATIQSILEQRGLQPRPTHFWRKRQVNEAAFDAMSEPAAYWLGFIATDGCIAEGKSGTPGKLIVQIHERDREHLEALKAFLKSEHPISVVPQKAAADNVRLSVGSQTLCRRLVDYGIVPRKSMRMAVSEELAGNRHFWRGAIDGNGWICAPDTKPVIEFVGSLPFLEQFCRFVGGKAAPEPHKSIYRVRMRGRNAVELALLLYGACDVALTRKRERAAALVHRWMTRKAGGVSLAA